MTKEFSERALIAAKTEQLDMSQRTILEGNGVDSLKKIHVFNSSYTSGFISGYLMGGNAEKNILLEKVAELIETTRQTILANANDPSWTEHLANLHTQINQLASLPADNKNLNAVERTQQECTIPPEFDYQKFAKETAEQYAQDSKQAEQKKTKEALKNVLRRSFKIYHRRLFQPHQKLKQPAINTEDK